jgi:hypothetical protein
MQTKWPLFLEKRSQWLLQEARHGHAAEKVAENILADFFTVGLDWEIGDLNHQLDYADMVLTKMGIKRLLVEVKRPNSLAWDEPSLERALAQARRYAEEQRVCSIAVSDGTVFYAADIANGGLKPRARLRLDRTDPALDAFWVSVDGIYRVPAELEEENPFAEPASAPPARLSEEHREPEADQLLHHKYKLPIQCFAYVEDAGNTYTWKLPYRLPSGMVDAKHLPGAIRSVVSNYRGARVELPEKAVPDVLVRLGKAAVEIGKMPGQTIHASETYQQLYDALRQMDLLKAVFARDGK